VVQLVLHLASPVVLVLQPIRVGGIQVHLLRLPKVAMAIQVDYLVLLILVTVEAEHALQTLLFKVLVMVAQAL
jgi:hypothetical protein